MNGLTAKWAHAVDGDGSGSVFSAAGVWPMLAFRTDGASGPAREEPGGALGVPAGEAAAAGRELLATMPGWRSGPAGCSSGCRSR
ncbi:hypothetical protein [Streptomyces sp. NBC_01485]|uniref:hypothetical protein n=1 Tax=Streptomyces sp. NBC_01485 TaxID=2903884 RepID=UPI002E315EB2|nr:hypothetical protein [Streptomyces sp. NBC_01485]